ncbi:hypothetical protein SP5_035_01230 [Sphingomonas parapaucimobilis NBRC 15100]|uniref:Uncharacterized protein n=1 Tax=Sphingomonas parapaucimobilis NBRC 15100 TaxID=1219049 RepID=A0A0A1W5V4_9SPHN|nr:hypothetical protein SP5_035_01230 [Sphingomonas parapaucimobilis NBRC 15100]
MTSSERLAQTRRKPPFLGIVRQLSQLRARPPILARRPIGVAASRAATTPPVGRPGPPPAPPKPTAIGKLSPALGAFQISGRIWPFDILFADLGRELSSGFMGSGE